MTTTLALAPANAAAPIAVAVTPAAEPHAAAPRRRTGSDTLLFTFAGGVLATVGAVSSLASGGIPALLASVTLLTLLTGVVLRVTFSLLDDDGDHDGNARPTDPR
jgi:hypothetical protein